MNWRYSILNVCSGGIRYLTYDWMYSILNVCIGGIQYLMYVLDVFNTNLKEVLEVFNM